MNRISVAEIPATLDPETVLLDVREDAEWAPGHAPQTVHAPLSRLNEVALQPDKTYLAVCRSGSRSMQVTAAMHRAGFSVSNVEGGMRAWVSEGKPLVSETGAAPAIA